MKARWILGVVLFGLLAIAGRSTAQELGDRRGIDHVGVLVRAEGFDEVVNVFSDQLGFSATPVLLSPLGVKNSLIWFRDESYLEIVTVTEVNEFTAPFAAFLEEHEGAMFYGTEVTDAARAMAFLTGAGYPNAGPVPAPPLTIESTGEVVGVATPLWNSILLTERVAPGNSLFFLDYDEAQVREMREQFPSLAPSPHPNTARKIETLWLVVSDLDAAIDFYEGLGLEVRAKRQKIPYLGGRGARVLYGNNQVVVLLEPDGPGLAADFAAERGEGVLGVSLKVDDLQTARDLIRSNTGARIQTFRYKGRERFLIPASLTHGLLIEMVE